MQNTLQRRRLTIWFILLFFIFIDNKAAASLIPPPIGAQAAIIMEAKTRTVIYEKQADRRMYPASTTKIMTFLLAQKLGNPDDVVEVSQAAAKTDGSSLGLSAGDKISLQDLLYGLMLVSGNDAATATAEHVAGSASAFVGLMNTEAQKIGALNTHFVNPHGLPDARHYSTAYDLALITVEALTVPDFSKITGTIRTQISFINGKTRNLRNTNRLLGQYPGLTGGKTGYTRAAGDCLVAIAERDGVQLIAVVLDDDDRWDDVPKLFDFGFKALLSNGN